jgi:hypothetical protein
LLFFFFFCLVGHVPFQSLLFHIVLSLQKIIASFVLFLFGETAISAAVSRVYYIPPAQSTTIQGTSMEMCSVSLFCRLLMNDLFF